MNYEELLRRKRQRPFQPFQVRLVDGKTYLVFSPEHFIVGRTLLVLGIADPSQEDPIPDDSVILYLKDVAGIEPAPPLVAPTVS